MKFTLIIMIVLSSLTLFSQAVKKQEQIESLLLGQLDRYKLSSKVTIQKSYHDDSSLAERTMFLFDTLDRALLSTLWTRYPKYLSDHGINGYRITCYFLDNLLVKAEVNCLNCPRTPQKQDFYFEGSKLISEEPNRFFVKAEQILFLASKQLEIFRKIAVKH